MDQLDELINRYDRREISRRDLLVGLALLGVSAGPGGKEPAARGRTINHVSLGVADLRRSTEFYDRLLGLPVLERGADFCEYRLENGFLGLYQDPETRRGIDHVAIGVEGYDPKAMLRTLQREFPDRKTELLYEDQVYIVDPDGASVQLCAVEYKR